MVRTNAVLLASFLLALALPALAQSQTSSSSSGTTNNSNNQSTGPETIQSQPLLLDQFNGSGVVDKLVPGVIKLSILDAIRPPRSSKPCATR